jgi:hypothetical protein
MASENVRGARGYLFFDERVTVPSLWHPLCGKGIRKSEPTIYDLWDAV